MSSFIPGLDPALAEKQNQKKSDKKKKRKGQKQQQISTATTEQKSVSQTKVEGNVETTVTAAQNSENFSKATQPKKE